MPDPENGGDASASQSSQNPNTGVAKPAPKKDPVLTAREEMLARMDEQIVEMRANDEETFYQTADPRALALAAEMGREARGERIAADSRQGRQQVVAAEADPVTQEADPDPAAEATRIDDAGRDPLEDYIVRQPGKPAMFKTVVNGKVKLVPLETARTQLQKHLSAEESWSRVNARQKALDAREAELRAAPVAQPIDDASIDTDATDLVRSLLSDPEAVAAKKMAATLRKIRQGATPQIDVNAVGQVAASIARREIAAEDTSKALANGLTKFQQDYPEISEGSELYLIADRKTETIAAEHPEWSPEQVMLEAGKQTREWVKSMGGKPGPKPTVVQLSSERQQLKQGLKPMPQSRSARPAPVADQNADQSPQDVMAEMRKARGQSY